VGKGLANRKGKFAAIVLLLLAGVLIKPVGVDWYEGLTASGNLSLSWNVSESGLENYEDVESVSYIVYCWNSERGSVEQIRITDPSVAQFELNKLRSGTYQCAVSAISESGVASALSNVVTRNVP
jgi:hypothetical protein